MIYKYLPETQTILSVDATWLWGQHPAGPGHAEWMVGGLLRVLLLILSGSRQPRLGLKTFLVESCLLPQRMPA